MSIQQKKKKTLTIISISILVLGLIAGSFWLGRISVKDNPPESKNNLPSNDQKIQSLKSELNSVKNELNHSNSNQKTQLENKLSNIENQIKNLSTQNNSLSHSTIKKLEQEIKEVKKKMKNNKLKDSPPPYTPPTDKNQLKFTVYYFGKVGQNHMWCDADTENSNKILLIDKENSIFPNNELTKRGNHYTITFYPKMLKNLITKAMFIISAKIILNLV